jgi:hypothetical protein
MHAKGSVSMTAEMSYFIIAAGGSIEVVSIG